MRQHWQRSASELQAIYRAGEGSPLEVAEACLARVGDVNPRLNAIVALDRDGALAAAVASTERWRRGEPLGGLDGVPLTVKDNLFVRGLPATWGSRLFEHHVAADDDLSVARLRAAGAVILGKTNTPELSLAGYTDNLVFGATGNPWAPDLSPGGSSGGAVAAVMSGMAPLALATDAGGSTRRPAAHTGCLGLKPSPARIPRRYGFPPLASDLQAIGLLTRTTADLAAMFSCVADPAASSWSRGKRLLIGAFAQIPGHPVEPDILARWRGGCALLQELGHTVEEIEPPFDPDGVGRLLLGPATAGVARVVRQHAGWQDRVTPAIAALAQTGGEAKAADYVDQMDAIQAFRWQMADLLARYDLLVTPTAPVLLWPKAEPFPKHVDGREAAPRAGAIYTTFANVAALAGLSIPVAAAANGQPIGLQLVGPAGSEERLIEIAGEWEQRAPWPTLAPL
ncbi:MAG: amidase [Hyphomicrobiaceae bacterium]